MTQLSGSVLSSLKIRAVAFIFFQTTIALGLALNSGLVGLNSMLSPPFCREWRTVSLNEFMWDSVYDGDGEIRFADGIYIKPKSAQSESQTHAGLVLLNHHSGMRNFGVRILYENEWALREPQANPWEVLWFFFNYQGLNPHKITNYLIFKPDGMELGKAWGEIDQEYLATTDLPKAQMGRTYELTVFKVGSAIRAYVDGHGALEFHSTNEKALFDQEGQIGLYSEDAAVHIKKVEICDSN